MFPAMASVCTSSWERSRTRLPALIGSIRYTPIWDVTPVMWTDAAINAGNRVLLRSQDDVHTEAMAGNIVSFLPGTPNAGLGGVNAIGAISNCPIIFTLPGRDYD